MTVSSTFAFSSFPLSPVLLAREGCCHRRREHRQFSLSRKVVSTIGIQGRAWPGPGTEVAEGASLGCHTGPWWGYAELTEVSRDGGVCGSQQGGSNSNGKSLLIYIMGLECSIGFIYPNSFFSYLNKIFKKYFLLFVAMRELSLVAASRGHWLRCAGFSLRWLLLLQSTGSRWHSFSSFGSQVLEGGFRVHGAWA